jgi:hypothetical protein
VGSEPAPFWVLPSGPRTAPAEHEPHYPHLHQMVVWGKLELDGAKVLYQGRIWRGWGALGKVLGIEVTLLVDGSVLWQL